MAAPMPRYGEIGGTIATRNGSNPSATPYPVPFKSGILAFGMDECSVTISEKKRYIIHCIQNRSDDYEWDDGGSGWNTITRRLPTITWRLFDNHGQSYNVQLTDYALKRLAPPKDINLTADKVKFPHPLSKTLIDFIKTNDVQPVCDKIESLEEDYELAQGAADAVSKENEILCLEADEKDARIAALEARVKELELLEAKVKTLEAQIEYATIPRIHIVSSPKPAATSDTTLLDLDDFFSTATSDDDIGNLPEFIHESP